MLDLYTVHRPAADVIARLSAAAIYDGMLGTSLGQVRLNRVIDAIGISNQDGVIGIDNIVDALLYLQVEMFDADRTSNENLGHSSGLNCPLVPRNPIQQCKVEQL